MSSCKFVTLVLTILSSILLYRIHHGSPHYLASCTLFALKCPVVKDGGTVINSNFIKVQQALKDFVESGEDIAAQISIFVNNKCQLNYYAVDSNRYPNYDEKSLHTVFSSTKNIAALLIAIAVNNKWIKSYNDKIIDYWPQFPTQQQYVHISKDNETGEEILKFESLREPKYITIADVLRHEGGLCKFWNHSHDIYFDTTNKNVTTYDSIRESIENSKLTYIYNDKNNGSMSFRCYHALTRGVILNELFKIVEPKHRFMNNYFKQEMENELKLNDPNFKLYFKGIKPKYNEKIYHIEQHNLVWLIYNFLIPLSTRIVSHLPQSICFKYLNESLCSNAGIFDIDKIKKYIAQRIEYSDTPETSRDEQKSFSKYFENELSMEYMSASGVTNSYSMSKLLSKYLFDNNNKLKNDVIKNMIKDPQIAYDTGIGFEFSFTSGGFAHSINDEMYFWMGWGGSLYAFIPKYKCVFAYTITGNARYDHGWIRETILLNLLKQDLKQNF